MSVDPSKPLPGEVNVVLRGLFLLVQRAPRSASKHHGTIEVLIPNMGSDHVYRAGNFLAEKGLEARELANPYLLMGVQAGSQRFDTEVNVVLSDFRYDHTATVDSVYARIVLPMPREILSLRPMRDAFSAAHDPLQLVHGRNTCGVQVLRYAATDLKKVNLHGHPATLAPFFMGGLPFVNLHVVCEPEFAAVMHDPAHDPSHHTAHGFHRTLHLIPGLRGVVKMDPKFRTRLTAANIPPGKGVADVETWTILELERRLRKTGEEWRGFDSGCPIPDPIDEPPQSCVPLIVDTGGDGG